MHRLLDAFDFFAVLIVDNPMSRGKWILMKAAWSRGGECGKVCEKLPSTELYA